MDDQQFKALSQEDKITYIETHWIHHLEKQEKYHLSTFLEIYSLREILNFNQIRKRFLRKSKNPKERKQVETIIADIENKLENQGM